MGARPRSRLISSALAAWLAATNAGAHVLPEPGRCPAYPAHDGAESAPDADALPADLRPGERISWEALERIRGYLPPEVWQRRRVFFFEGQRLEIGPCHRRYLAPPAFDAATRTSAGRAALDAAGNLLGHAGAGLPFAPGSIEDDEPAAAAKWAWNYRYRHLGGGLRGPFRILHIARGGATRGVFEGEFFVQPLHGLVSTRGMDAGRSFAAGGRFSAPAGARGLAWRQYVPSAADRDAARSDEVFVWLPGARRIRRALPQPGEGLYVPEYGQARASGNEGFQLPDRGGAAGRIALGATGLDPVRRGFTGLLLRPNAYVWREVGFRDVLAPLALRAREPDGYGPGGLSLASGRWDLRRAAVLRAVPRSRHGPVRELRLWIDAQSLAPLYLITRSSGGSVLEVMIFAGRLAPDDPLAAAQEGFSDVQGTILPVAQSAWVAGDASWLRESFALGAGVPDPAELRELLSTRSLGRER